MTRPPPAPTSKPQALAAILPFLAFGMVSMLGKVGAVSIIQWTIASLCFYFLMLLGAWIGWLQGFPLWSYSYLGWSLVFAWAWSNLRIAGVEVGYRIWVPLGIMVITALVWTRSSGAVQKLAQDIRKDWTRLTLLMYTFVAFGLLIYDENHHPYLLLWMAVTTGVVASGVWFFIRSATHLGRVLSIMFGYAAATVPIMISYLTWDWRAYYGLPPSVNWYEDMGVAPQGIAAWLLILLAPGLFPLLKQFVRRYGQP